MVNAPLTASHYKTMNCEIERGTNVALASAEGNEILMRLAARPGADMKARLLLALTALFMERPIHTAEEQRQYVELALRLIEQVDAATQETVAAMLRNHAAAPVEVCVRLGIAPPTPRELTDCASNPAEIPPADDAAPEPAAIPDAAALGEAFFAADAAERRRLLSLLPAEPETAMAGFPATPEDAARFYAGLDAAALKGRIGEFIREFERRLAIPRSLSERIVNDHSGEPMVIAAKAANMPIAVLQRLLLLVNAAVGHSVQRVYDLTKLYHELDRGKATRIFVQWRAEAKPDPVLAGADSTERRPPRDQSVASLRARFGALSDRVGERGVSVRSDAGSAVLRDLRSR
jgi:hypothetical protein